MTDLQILLIFIACVVLAFAYMWVCDRVRG